MVKYSGNLATGQTNKERRAARKAAVKNMKLSKKIIAGILSASFVLGETVRKLINL